MKIERLSENQIRCTLYKADLADKELLLTELAYGTDKAKELHDDYDRISQEMSERYYIGFSETEIIQFEAYLQRVLANLEEESL